MTSEDQPQTEPSGAASVIAPLGRVVVSFNYLEMILSMSIWTLLGCDQFTGQCVTAQLPFKGLINAFCSLWYRRTSDPGIVASVQSLRVRLEAAEQRRNELLHSLWAVGTAQGTSTRFKYSAKAKRGWAVQSADLSAADVDAVADEMTVLSKEVMKLLTAFLRSLPNQAP